MPLMVLEGVDGCGKSTQCDLLVQRLQSHGLEVLQWREPGGTELGEQVRELLLNPATKAGPVAELFGYQMARAQLVEEVLAPAVQAGRWVLLDRFWYSTLAYQAYGLGLPVEQVRSCIDLAIGDLWVDLAMYFRIDVELAAKRRAAARGEDRIEARGLDYQQRVADGYECLVEAGDLVAVDAEGSPEAIAEQVWKLVVAYAPDMEGP